jgi:hypothetical protein
MSDPVALEIIVAIPGTIAAIGTAVIGIMVAMQNRTMRELERNTNSKMDKLLEVTSASEYAKGKLDGQRPHDA